MRRTFVFMINKEEQEEKKEQLEDWRKINNENG